MAYHIKILSSNPTASGDINLDIEIESDSSGDWKLILGGQRVLVLDGDVILAITESGDTETQKITALKALFKQEIAAWGLDKSDDANEQLLGLIDLPTTVNL